MRGSIRQQKCNGPTSKQNSQKVIKPIFAWTQFIYTANVKKAQNPNIFLTSFLTIFSYFAIVLSLRCLKYDKKPISFVNTDGCGEIWVKNWDYFRSTGQIWMTVGQSIGERVIIESTGGTANSLSGCQDSQNSATRKWRYQKTCTRYRDAF